MARYARDWGARFDEATKGRGCESERQRGHSGRLARSSKRSSSGSPVTPATACSSPVTGSPPRPLCSAMTLRHNRITPPRSAHQQGTLPGVSSFQIQIADYDILTAGDRPDVLVAMNPAALKANISDLPRGGLVIANSDEFTKRNLAKVGYEANPLETDELSDYVVQAVAMTTLTLGAVESIGAIQEGRPARQEHVRARPAVVDVRPRARAQRGVHPREVRPQARHRRGQRAGAEGRLELRRDHRGVRHHLRGGAGQAEVRRVPPDLGQHRAGVRPRHRRPARRHPGGARQLPDHARRRTSCTSCPSTRTSTS